MLQQQARNFGESLVARDVISRETLEDALLESERTGEPLPELLRRRGLVGPKDPAALYDDVLAALHHLYAPPGTGRPGAPAGPATTASPAMQEAAPSIDPLLERLIDQILELRASDLHLSAGQPPLARVLGELRRLDEHGPLPAERIREMCFSIITPAQQARFAERNELDSALSVPGKARFRVNLFVQRDAIGAALRTIPSHVVPFDDLGMPPVIKELARTPRGIVLVTGPTGSGKSTTLASLIDVVNTERAAHIMTVEEPIEFVHTSKLSLVNQRDVGRDTESFGIALRQALRQDPDVILVGEMRDLETVSTAIAAAETGHLVFATLHTQDAPQTIDRIIDVFPAEQQDQIRAQLANSIQGIVTQALVPAADGSRRLVACEVLVATPAIRALIRDGKIHQVHSMIQSGKKLGMQTLDESLGALVKAGLVRPEDALAKARNPDEVRRYGGLPPAPPAA